MKAQGLALAGILLAATLAGCAGDAPKPQDPTLQSGALGGAGSGQTPTVATPLPVVKPTSQRWHFHDYWKGSPTITLLDANITLNATTTTADGVPALGALVDLPNGVIVPPETGLLTLNVTWTPATTGVVNVTYKPSDSNDYFAAGDAAPGKGLVIPTTESMCDVPHRQQSLWRLNLTAKPGGTPPAPPARDIHVTLTATIGRPLFIDPPHVDWWQASDVLTLIAGSKGDIATAATPAGNLTLTGATPSSPPSQEDVRVAVDPGMIVPEGAQSIVVMLNWTTDVPNAKLALRYKESNLPSEGLMTVQKDGEKSRILVLPIQPPQTDTTYSNRTTWEFHVRPDAAQAAFRGSFTIVAWATRLAPDAAVAAVTAK